MGEGKRGLARAISFKHAINCLNGNMCVMPAMEELERERKRGEKATATRLDSLAC